jgi:hypothetical protein
MTCQTRFDMWPNSGRIDISDLENLQREILFSPKSSKVEYSTCSTPRVVTESRIWVFKLTGVEWDLHKSKMAILITVWCGFGAFLVSRIVA